MFWICGGIYALIAFYFYYYGTKKKYIERWVAVIVGILWGILVPLTCLVYMLNFAYILIEAVWECGKRDDVDRK